MEQSWATQVGLGEYFPWKTDEEVAEHFFSTTGVSMEQLKEHPAGLYFGEVVYNLFEQIGFSTDTKKIELYSGRMADLGFPGIPGHVEPQQSHVADPVFAEQYPEVLLTGARREEWIGAQMRDVPALRVRIPEPEAEISPITAKKYDIMDGEMIGVQTARTIRLKLKLHGYTAWCSIHSARLGNGQRQFAIGCKS